MASLFIEIGKKIQEMLTVKGIKQSELANCLGITRQVMNKIIQGKKAINVEEILMIAEALNVRMEDLVPDKRPERLQDGVMLLMGKIEHPEAKEEVRFLNYVMDEMISLEEMLGRGSNWGKAFDFNLSTWNEATYLTTNYDVILESLVKSKLGELNKTSRILKGEIFNILADHSRLIHYPISDEEFSAMVCYKKNRLYSVVNSNMPYDKQLFAAAHELYHIWFDQDVLYSGEVLSRNVLDSESEHDVTELELRERLANRFAALLLVPTDVLRDELEYLKVKSSSLELSHIVRLMDTFGVPYKTMVRRLREIDFITSKECKAFLEIPDRDERDGVLLLQKRLRLGLESQQRTQECRFANLVEDAVDAYGAEKISYEKLRDLLSYSRIRPEELLPSAEGDDYLSDEELLHLLDEE